MTAAAQTATEPVWLLKALPYGDYRNTRWWKRRRELYIEHVREKSGKGVLYCEMCMAVRWGKSRDPIPMRLHVHHVSYGHLGEERDEDLRLLCSPCHNLVHFPDSHAARHWVAHTLGEGIDLQARAIDIGAIADT